MFSRRNLKIFSCHPYTAFDVQFYDRRKFVAPVTIIGTQDIPLADLTPFPGNARRGNVALLRESVKEHGQYRSVVVRRQDDGTLVVLAGNHTVEALREEGAATARAEVITCTDTQAKKINVADNRLSDVSTNDDQDLMALLAEIAASDEGLYGTGYTEDDIAKLIHDLPDFDPDDMPPSRLDELAPNCCRKCGYDNANNPDDLEPWPS